MRPEGQGSPSYAHGTRTASRESTTLTFMPPELGVLVNSQPRSANRAHASYTSGTVMPRWPKPPRTF
eukprot:scaffold174210_cov33-Tisochrysis_lutea.AAC.1